MWLLSRNGWQQGPFSQVQVEQMIAAGKANGSLVCAEGDSSWISVRQHPIFGSAVTRAIAVPGPMTASTGTVLATETTEARAGREFVAPGSVARGPRGMEPSAPVAPSSPAFGPRRGPAARPPTSSRTIGWLLGLWVAFALLVVTIAAIAARGRSSELADAVPEDIEVYVELSDLPGALQMLPKMRFVDESRVEVEDALEDLAEELHDAFDLDEGPARELLGDIDAAALAVRGQGREEETVVLLRFSHDAAIAELFETRRFDDDGKIGKTGILYSVDRERVDPLRSVDGSGARRALARFSVGRRDDEGAIAWHPGRQLLVLGSSRLVDDVFDVLDDGARSLAASEAWAEASFEPNARAIAFADSTVDPQVAEFFAKHPISTSLELTEDGVLTTIEARLRVPVEVLEDGDIAREAELPARLPESTIAYTWLGLPSNLSGEEVERSIVDIVGSQDRELGRDLSATFTRAKYALGVDLPTVWDALGAEAVVAMVGPDGSRPLTSDEFEQRVAVGLMLSLEEEEPFERLIESLGRQAMDSRGGEWPMGPTSNWKIVDSGARALELVRRDGSRVIRLAVVDEVLVLAVGSRRGADALVDAMAGKGRHLGDDPAHAKAFDMIDGAATYRGWLDVGAIAQQHERIGARVGDLGSYFGGTRRSINISGDDRLTVASAGWLEVDGDEYHLRLQSLNGMPGFELGFMAAVAEPVIASAQRRLHSYRATTTW